MARFLAVPVDMAEANRLVAQWHRRHGRVPDYKLALAAAAVRGGGARSAGESTSG